MKCIRWFQITTMAIASMLFLVISGCGSVQPLRPDQLEKLRSGKIAVSAYDRSKTITYNNLTYYGLGIAQTQTTATYAGFFDSEKILGEQFSTRLNKHGLKSSIYQIPTELWTPALVKQFSERVNWTGSDLDEIPKDNQKLPLSWRERLISSGFDFLFLPVSQGVVVYVSNFDTKSVNAITSAGIYLYDVKKGEMIWAHVMSGGKAVAITNSPKEIEGNNFVLFNELFEKSVETYFTMEESGGITGIEVGMGLRLKAQ